jgi:hypothetical protein
MPIFESSSLIVLVESGRLRHFVTCFSDANNLVAVTGSSAATQRAAMTTHGSTLVSKATSINTVTGQQATVPLVRSRVYKRN